MEINCKKCGHALKVPDKLLIEESLDFPCPNCRGNIKIERSLEKEETDDESEDNKTEIYTPFSQLSDDEDATILKDREDKASVLEDEKSAEPIEIEGEILEPQDPISSLISDIRDMTEESPEMSLSYPSFSKDSKRVSLEKTELIRSGKGPAKHCSSPKKKDDSDVHRLLGPKQLYDPSKFRGYEVSFKQTGKLEYFLKNPAKIGIKYLPLFLIILFAAVALLYPYFSLRGLFTREGNKPPRELAETLTLVSLYGAHGSADALMRAKEIIEADLAEFGADEHLWGELSKVYSELYRASPGEDLKEKTLEAVSKALAGSKTNSDAYRALANYEHRDPGKSAFYLNRAIALDSSKGVFANPENYYIKANIELSVGNLQDARESLKKAVSIDPDHLKSYKLLRDIAKIKGDRLELESADKTVSSIEEKFYAALPELKPKPVVHKPATTASDKPAPVNISVEKSPVPTAKSIVEKTAAEKPKSQVYGGLLDKGNDFFEKSQYIEAEKSYLNALEQYARENTQNSDPKEMAKIYNRLGYTYIKLYRTDSAMEAFQSSASFDQSNAETHKALANLYEELGENHTAIEEYNLYLKYNPGADDKAQILKRIENLKN